MRHRRQPASRPSSPPRTSSARSPRVRRPRHVTGARRSARFLHVRRPRCATGARRSGRSPSVMRRNIARRAVIHDRPPCAGQGQRSRAMRDQRASVARARARDEDDEALPYAAAPWPVRCRFFFVSILKFKGPRPEVGFLRQPALEGLTRSAWTDSPRRIGRERFSGEERRRRTTAAAFGEEEGTALALGLG
ncbi:hypothetical protein F511_21616 [Dorcoceras hygrometricum]|uniref:Uncharacterized protein n=1 Tax=Dorcoceras hygrometricum TaxID=472368 RepID=A0A2Z7BVN9_9LAMI|nr:hypothetical protein F511_21616 [Dorcoceras hygrometricum]